MAANQSSYHNVTASRGRGSRRMIPYENDEEHESEVSVLETLDKEPQDSKEESSVSSANVTPSQSRSDNHDNHETPTAFFEQHYLNADQQCLFNKLDVSDPIINATRGYIQESIAEEKRIKDLANSAHHE